MIISKQMIEERLQLYQKELQQLPILQKIYEGAVQDCQHWLTILEKEEEIDKQESVSSQT